MISWPSSVTLEIHCTKVDFQHEYSAKHFFFNIISLNTHKEGLCLPYVTDGYMWSMACVSLNLEYAVYG